VSLPPRHERTEAIRNSPSLQFNDGRAVPEALVWQTVEELELRFGAVSWDSQIVRGIWEHEGTLCRDNNTRLALDVEDSQENRAFFTTLKESLKKRFGQLDIWITSYVVDVI
jgi:hypothetical protein